MAAVPGPYTLEMWERLPRDGNRYELLDGQLVVTPLASPIHQTLVARLVMAIGLYLETHHLGQVWPGIDFHAGPSTVLEPDVAVGLGETARSLRSWKEFDRPALAVEILSPGSARYDRGPKRERYLARGCEYWVVDPDARAVERWVPGASEPSIHRASVAWQPDASIEALTIDVGGLFRDLL